VSSDSFSLTRYQDRCRNYQHRRYGCVGAGRWQSLPYL